MILAVDVQYTLNAALAAGILFSDWKSDNTQQLLLKSIDKIAPYEPGSFYKRELPCILALLSEVNINLDVIIVDGYVMLGKDNTPGLGMHLYNSLNGAIPVIGVAKKEFIGTPNACQLQRGKSQKPLYITSVGIELSLAKFYIASMHGKYRIPTLLKKVDQLCRGIDNSR